jgi:integrase
MRAWHKLSASFVRGAGGDGRWSDGGGLYLQGRNGGLSWIFNFTRHGRTRSMGLGAAQVVSLALAREFAAEKRRLLARGLDPFAERQRKVEEARVEQAKRKTFKECAEDYLAANGGRWRNAKHRKEWESAVTRFAYPVLGHLPVQSIDSGLVIQVLQPIIDKRVTANRLRSRIESVLDYAKAAKRRDGDNPASKDIISHLLPLKAEKADVVHQPALPFALLPDFMAELRKLPAEAPVRLMELIVLSGMRLNAVRLARCHEFDLSKATWTVPAERMKRFGRQHRIPLVGRALELARALTEGRGPQAFVFGEIKPCAESLLAQEVLPKVLRAIGYSGPVTTHGFRSCLDDWASETTSFAFEVIEETLAHKIKSEVKRAYRRGDLFDKRRDLMTAWTRYCSGEPTAEVIALRA